MKRMWGLLAQLVSRMYQNNSVVMEMNADASNDVLACRQLKQGCSVLPKCNGAIACITSAQSDTNLQADDQIGQPILRVWLPFKATPGRYQVIQYERKPSGNPHADKGCDDAEPSLGQNIVRHSSKCGSQTAKSKCHGRIQLRKQRTGLRQMKSFPSQSSPNPGT